jgi:hypothetical protein
MDWMLMTLAAAVAGGCVRVALKTSQNRNGMLFASDMEIPEDLLVTAEAKEQELEIA